MSSAVALSRGAAGGPAQPGVLRAVDTARDQFLAGQRVDMRALAGALGVSRTTLYRWVGDREQLLAEVLWSLLVRTVERCRRSAEGTGSDRLVDLAMRMNAEIVASAPLAHFVRSEPETALRVLTSAASSLQLRTIWTWQTLLDDAVEGGQVTLSIPTPTLAQILVRVGQSFLWPDLVAGTPVRAEDAAQVYRALLR